MSTPKKFNLTNLKDGVYDQVVNVIKLTPPALFAGWVLMLFLTWLVPLFSLTYWRAVGVALFILFVRSVIRSARTDEQQPGGSSTFQAYLLQAVWFALDCSVLLLAEFLIHLLF